MKTKQSHKERINPSHASLFQILSILFGLIIIAIGVFFQVQDDYYYSADINEKLKHTFLEVLVHLGSVGVALGILELAHRKLIDREFAEDIDGISNLFKVYKDIKITNIIDEMGQRFFKDKLEKSQETTLIITYFPGIEVYCSELKESPSFKNNKCKIYLLNKDNMQVNLRNSSLNNVYGVKDKIVTSESFLNDNNISFISYNSMIAFPIFIFDKTAYIGFYRYGNEAISMPWIEIDMNGEFGQHIKKHINILEGIVAQEIVAQEIVDEVDVVVQKL